MAVSDVSDRSLADLMSLSGRRAVVTGGARGIGYAISRRLAEAGASVLIADLNEAGAEEAAAGIVASGGKAAFAFVDVSDSVAIVALIDQAVKDLGGIDIWVNNAGIFPSTPLLDITDADWDRVLNINLRGTFIASREVGRRMIEAGNGGVIINLASLAAFSAYGPGFAHYTPSKHGVLGLTKSLAVELGPHNIRVLAVAPTLTDTPGLEEGLAAYKEVGLDNVMEQMALRMPLRRNAVPDDIARVVFFCASDLAMLMTGSTILVDAGDVAV
jgi:NAD(P)-dependent dehydrogenase (short-subunit alcohol dehydrogenase family)